MLHIIPFGIKDNLQEILRTLLILDAPNQKTLLYISSHLYTNRENILFDDVDNSLLNIGKTKTVNSNYK